MSANYLDRAKYLYPGLTQVVYWATNPDGSDWMDAYDGLVWENKSIPKPSKATLDALDDATVAAEIAKRNEVARKAGRDMNMAKDMGVVAGFQAAQTANPKLLWTNYLDSLEAVAAKVGA